MYNFIIYINKLENFIILYDFNSSIIHSNIYLQFTFYMFIKLQFTQYSHRFLVLLLCNTLLCNIEKFLFSIIFILKNNQFFKIIVI